MMARVYGTPFADGAGSFGPERFFATVGGMHALQLAMRIVAGVGDEAIVLTPAWPNFSGALTISGARTIEVPLAFDRREAGWRWGLDFGRLRDAVTDRTRAIVVNTPANPTGWTATLDELRAILTLARERGLWIVADEIYGRFYYAGARAPSFHDVMDESDRILFVNTMSKNWAMTGWRSGWLEAPPALGQTIEEHDPVLDLGRAALRAARRNRGAGQWRGFRRAAAVAREPAAPRLIETLGPINERLRFAAPEGKFLASSCRSSAKAIRATSPSGWSMRQASGWRRARRSGKAARPSCGSALHTRPEGHCRSRAPHRRLGQEVTRPDPSRLGLPPFIAQCVTIAGAALAGAGVAAVGVPAGWLSGAMMGTALLAALRVAEPLTTPFRWAAMVSSGVAIGAAVTPQMLQKIAAYPISIAIMAASVAISTFACAKILERAPGWSRSTAFFASVPGALSYVFAVAATDEKADLSRIAVVQVLRVFLLMGFVPLIVAESGASLAGAPTTAR